MKALVLALLVAAQLGWIGPAGAQEYPNKPIRVVIPYNPGAFPDTIGRLFAAEMTKVLQQPMVIENRQGAGGVVGSEIVAKANPDGYTLLLNDVQLWAIAPLIIKNLPFDPHKDFAPVSILGTTPLFLVMSSSIPTSNNLRELIGFLKASPGKYNYGTAGIGTIHHFAAEAVLSKAGLDLTHVPYKGGAALLQGLATGEVAIGFQALTVLPQFVQKGTVKIVAVATAQRSPVLPAVPTFSELGLDDIVFPGSMGLLAPRATPAAVIAKLAAAVQHAAKDGEVRKRLAALSIVPEGNTPADMAAWIKEDVDRYNRVAKALKMEPQ